MYVQMRMFPPTISPNLRGVHVSRELLIVEVAADVRLQLASTSMVQQEVYPTVRLKEAVKFDHEWNVHGNYVSLVSVTAATLM